MRVGLLSFGFAEYCIALAGALADHVDVTLILPEDEAAPYACALDPRVRYLPFDKPRFREPLRQIRMLRGLLEAIRGLDPDVIHLQQGHLWFNFALPLLRRYPLVVTVHDPVHHSGDAESRKTPQRIMELGFREASRLIVHGARLRDQAADAARLPAARVHVVPHHWPLPVGVVSDRPGSDGRTVLFFGRIWPYKGLDYLIRAEPHISACIPDARFVIAGQGEDLKRYRGLMVHPDRFVERNTFVSDAERSRLFEQADVIVLPYVEATQSGVIPVAYAHAKPVVATMVGALPDIVDDGETGLLVPPRDERALASAVVRLLSDRDLAFRLGQQGRRKLEVELSPAVVAQRTVEVYRQTVQEWVHGPAAARSRRIPMVGGQTR